MGTHMKTTIEIATPLLEEAKAIAAKEKTTLRALVEEGLRQILRSKRSRNSYLPADGSVDGGGLTPEMEARGGWAKIRHAAYPGFFDDDEGSES